MTHGEQYINSSGCGLRVLTLLDPATTFTAGNSNLGSALLGMAEHNERYGSLALTLEAAILALASALRSMPS